MGVEEIMERHPFIRFSLYTQTQTDTLIDVGNDICEKTEKSFSDGNVLVMPPYGLFWLWVLGAYEVLRTMAQANTAWEEGKLIEINDFKTKLAKIRMPFAKQEHRGQKSPIAAENSISVFNLEKKDFAFTIENETVYACELIKEFIEFIGGFSCTDVLQDHRETYQS